MKDTIGDILSIRFEGNFGADAEKLHRISEFELRDDVSREDKYKAFCHANDVGMGCPHCPKEQYFEYLDEHNGE